MKDFPEIIDRQTTPADLAIRGVPSYMAASKFKLKEALYGYSAMDGKEERPVTNTQQVRNLNKVLDGEPGALIYMCGDYERMKLFTYNLMLYHTLPRYGFQMRNSQLLWKHMPRLLHEKNYTHDTALCTTLDCLAAHTDKQYDYVRADTIREYISRRRSSTTLIVLCPDMEPTDAQKALKHEYNLAFMLRKGPQRY